MAYVDEMMTGPPTVEVRVHTLRGQSSNFYMDKFAFIGDVKQRMSKDMGRKFHEVTLAWVTPFSSETDVKVHGNTSKYSIK